VSAILIVLKNQRWHQHANSLWPVVFDMLREKFNLSDRALTLLILIL